MCSYNTHPYITPDNRAQQLSIATYLTTMKQHIQLHHFVKGVTPNNSAVSNSNNTHIHYYILVELTLMLMN